MSNIQQTGPRRLRRAGVTDQVQTALGIIVAESQYPWEAHYIAAILETEPAKLPERVVKARAAIASRGQELV